MLKALAVDVDGTITSNGGKINFKAVSALRWMERLGKQVILASGRTHLELYTLAAYFGTTRVVVGENGGVVAILPDKIVLLGDKSKCLEAYDLLTKKFTKVVMKQTYPRFTDVVLQRTFNLEEGRNLIKENNLPIELSDSKYAFHVNLIDVNKSKGLNLALRYISVKPEEVAAIGDSETDIPMFNFCGYGIALANAPDKAKKAASYVTERGMGEGLVEAIDHVADRFFKVQLTK